jgi:CheY-like chemotaxis protein
MPLKILIADDDVDDLDLLEESILEVEEDASVIKAKGGAIAIRLLDSSSATDLPQLIILDYNMPDVSGLEVLIYLKTQKRYDQIPRVIFSTSGAERHVAESLGHGATRYLVKPMTKKELDKLTAQMLSLAITK